MRPRGEIQLSFSRLPSAIQCFQMQNVEYELTMVLAAKTSLNKYFVDAVN
jgi:hypothetical protein